MGFHRGSKIVTNGLIMLLDAANEKCFVDPETDCKNLIGKDLGVGASGASGTSVGSGAHTEDTTRFPTYDSANAGIFDYTSNKAINMQKQLGSYSAITYNVWIKKTSTGGSQYVSDARNNGGTYFLTNYASYNINYGGILKYNFSETYDAADTDFINKWVCISITSDSVGSVMYVNGIQVTTGVSVNENIGINFRIGCRFTNSNYFVGYMGPFSIYNRKLTATEVTQNYNALKTRYGL